MQGHASLTETVQICFDAHHQPPDEAESTGDDTNEHDDYSFGTIFDSPQRVGTSSQGCPVDSEVRDALFRDELRTKVELEVANYLNIPVHISHRQDPLVWWRENKHLYPNLARTARKWLCVCATSTPSERVFFQLWCCADSKALKAKWILLTESDTP